MDKKSVRIDMSKERGENMKSFWWQFQSVASKLSVSLNLFLPKIITLAKRSWQLQGPQFPLAIVNNVSVANQLYPVAVHQHTEVI